MAAWTYEISLLMLKNISGVSVSPSGYVIFFLLNKILTIHQKTKKTTSD